MAEIANHQKSPATPQSPAILANCLGVPPHAQHIIHVHLCNNPHIVSQHPHASQMVPHGKCMKLLSDCAIILPHHKTFVPHNLEASHAQPLRTFSEPSLCSHFWPLHSLC